eukprot:GHVU01004687.1.p1 GENE.GHVU01004687.1~~GHVU01004687.1.p1  ORF type:complete len:591 (-),score=94.03 GHVU01004687.1:1984-3522(-)
MVAPPATSPDSGSGSGGKQHGVHMAMPEQGVVIKSPRLPANLTASVRDLLLKPIIFPIPEDKDFEELATENMELNTKLKRADQQVEMAREELRLTRQKLERVRETKLEGYTTHEVGKVKDEVQTLLKRCLGLEEDLKIEREKNKELAEKASTLAGRLEKLQHEYKILKKEHGVLVAQDVRLKANLRDVQIALASTKDVKATEIAVGMEDMQRLLSKAIDPASLIARGPARERRRVSRLAEDFISHGDAVILAAQSAMSSRRASAAPSVASGDESDMPRSGDSHRGASDFRMNIGSGLPKGGFGIPPRRQEEPGPKPKPRPPPADDAAKSTGPRRRSSDTKKGKGDRSSSSSYEGGRPKRHGSKKKDSLSTDRDELEKLPTITVQKSLSIQELDKLQAAAKPKAAPQAQRRPSAIGAGRRGSAMRHSFLVQEVTAPRKQSISGRTPDVRFDTTTQEQPKQQDSQASRVSSSSSEGAAPELGSSRALSGRKDLHPELASYLAGYSHPEQDERGR